MTQLNIIIENEILLWRRTDYEQKQKKKTLEGVKVTQSKFVHGKEIKVSSKKNGAIPFEALENVKILKKLYSE